MAKTPEKKNEIIRLPTVSWTELLGNKIHEMDNMISARLLH